MSEAWQAMRAADLAALGHTPKAVRVALERGELGRLRPGVFLAGPRLEGADGWYQDVAAAGARAADHVLLLLRGHRRPTDAEPTRFAAGFGELFDGGEIFGVQSPTKEILRLSSERSELGVETGLSAVTPLAWHTDYSYLPCAARETFLEAVVIPADGGGRTWFANLYDAWETLPASKRAELDGLVGIHTIKGSGRHLRREDRQAIREGREVRNREFSYPGGRVPANHPIAQRHPDAGRTALYVNSLVAGIEGWDAGLSLRTARAHRSGRRRRGGPGAGG
jgi:taurine dioxygenase